MIALGINFVTLPLCLFIHQMARYLKGILGKHSHGSLNHEIEWSMHTHRRNYFDYLLLNL